MSYFSANRTVYNNFAKSRSRFARVATDVECAQPMKALDGRGWLPQSIKGWNVLCLAAGGGWQSILYATAGAKVTVLDLSPEMLKLDAREAERRQLVVQCIEGSMDDLSELGNASFDLVHQPVSTCYVPDLGKVYGEIARVLKPGGLYISQHKHPVSLQITDRDPRDRYTIGIEYYREGPLPPVVDQSYREPGATEFLHTLEEIIGGLCQTGFVIEAFAEPRRDAKQAKPGDFRHRGRFVPPYVRLKARLVEAMGKQEGTGLWVP